MLWIFYSILFNQREIKQFNICTIFTIFQNIKYNYIIKKQLVDANEYKEVNY